MKQGKEVKGYEKVTNKYAHTLAKAEKQLELLTAKYLKGKLSTEELYIYTEMCNWVAQAKSSIKYEECGEYVNKLEELQLKLSYIAKKFKR